MVSSAHQKLWPITCSNVAMSSASRLVTLRKIYTNVNKEVMAIYKIEKVSIPALTVCAYTEDMCIRKMDMWWEEIPEHSFYL